MKVLFVIFFVIVSSLNSFGQQGIYQEWVSRYNGTANAYDGGVSIKTDGSGNVFISGTSFCVNTSRDYITIKYSSTGGVDWVRTFNGAANGGDYSNAMTLDNSGNVYVTGRCDNGSTSSDYTTIKYNSGGTQQWVAYYNGPAGGVDEAKTIAADNSGNVYVSGKSAGQGTGFDIATLKYDANGNQLWVMRYNGPNNGDDVAYSMALDGDNNVYICGESNGVGTGDDGVFIKYNSDGVQQWVVRYNGPGNGGDGFVSVKTDNSNFIYITGFSDGGASTGYDFYTAKYNPQGNQLWAKRYNGMGNHTDYPSDLGLDQSGNVYVTGGSIGNSDPTDTMYATVKYDNNGNQQWVQWYPGPSGSSNMSHALVTDYSGNVIITGSSFYNGFNHYVTIKYDTYGNQKWLMTYSGLEAGNDFATALAVDINNNVFVTGRSWGIDYDVATIKYGPELLGIQTSGNTIPTEYSLEQNYPNPFNPETNIKFSIPVAGDVNLSVYDIQGNKVAVILNRFLSANEYNVKWDGTNFSSGVYFYKLQANSIISTKKMMLVK